MTEQEKKIKRYVNAIERELRLPLKAKARINGAIGTDIHARLEKGQSIDEIDVYKRQLFGGASSEHEVSRMSATSVLNNLDLSLIHI